MKFASLPTIVALCLVVPVLGIPRQLAAQAVTTGTLIGVASDPSGATVPTATVTVRSGAVVRSVPTQPDGRFSLPNLPPGDYALAAIAPGLASVPKPITVRAAAIVAVDITLDLESVREELVVGAQRLGGPTAFETRLPGSYETIGREVLDLTHPHDVNEVLRKFSGVTVRDEEGLGLRPNIGIRGLNPTRSSKTLLLEDGVPITFAPYGDNASYYHPPIERFDAVEILKGSGQIAFGPSTIGGVVNYITPVPPSRTAGSVFATAGNRDYTNVTGTLGTTRGRVGVLFDGMRKESDGARANTHSALSDIGGKLVATAGNTHVFTVKGSYYAEDSQLTYSGLRSDEFASDPRQNPFANDAFAGDRFGGSVAHAGALTDRLLLTTTGYVSHFARDWWRQSSNSTQRPNDSSDPNCASMANLSTTCGNEGRLRRYLTLGLESKAHLDVGFTTVDAGMRVHREQQERRQENGPTPRARAGVTVENNARDADAVSAFVQPRLTAGKLAITPGLRMEHVRFERTNRLAGDSLTGTTALTQWIPGVAGSWAVGDDALLFAGIHRGFAPPRVEDVITNAGGVVDLDAELSWNTEIGVRARLFQGLALSGAWFQMDYQNQIVPASVAGGAGATLTNAGETVHRGVELSARVDSSSWRQTMHNVYARLATTFLPTARFTGARTSNIRGFEAISVSGNRLPYAPRHTTTATIGVSARRWFDVSLEASAVGAQFADDLNSLASSADGQRGVLPSSVVWNAAANVFLKPSRITAYLAVKNVTDRLYIVDRSRGLLPGAPRLIQGGVRVTF
ncbi:MAG TPA: TonB-dependent receptor [Vicinamibacterales bacterium]|nr:TonB-dependent receptor [Vicinamibacterales bacterium]